MRIPSGVGGKFPTQKPAIDKVAEHIDDVVTVAESITSGQFDKVSVPEVRVVATSIKEVKQVAEVEQYVRMLAQDLSNIDLIGSQLAGVLNVSNNMAAVLLLHSRMADLLDIKKSLVHIDAVALNEERINSVYEIIPEIATLVSHMASLVHIDQAMPQLEAVFKNLDAILLTSSNVEHIVNVSTNIDTILEASDYVNKFYTLIEQINESEAHIVELEASSKVNAEVATAQAGIATDKALEAKGYADSASASKVASAASQVAAKSSEDKAKASETASASSAAKALVSEGNAKKSEDAAKASEGIVAANVVAAKASEDNAKLYEADARASKMAAAGSATTAGTNANLATTEANKAKGYASDALTSKNAAASSATTASTGATTATTKAAEALATEQRVLAAAESQLGGISSIGDTQVARVTFEGDTQTSRVVMEGGVQVARVALEGTSQIAAATAQAQASDASAVRSEDAARRAEDLVGHATGGALLKEQNLSDVPNKDAARTNLSVMSSAQVSDAISAATQNAVDKTKNLADIPSKSDARANLDVPSNMQLTQSIAAAIGGVTPASIGARPDSWIPTAADVGAVAKTGDTMTGNLTAPAVLVSSAQNTSVNALTRKDYVDSAIAASSVPFPDVWIPFNDSLRMLAGYGDDIKVGDYTVATQASFSRASTATYIDKSGVLRTAAINEPRFEKEGLLIEGQSTNLITRSADMTQAPWSGTAVGTGVVPVVTGNYASAPDGSQTATRLVLNKGAGSSGSDESTMRCSLTTTTGSAYTLSVWLKSTDGVSSPKISLSFNGEVPTTITLTGEWRRYQITTTSAMDTNRTPRLQLRGGFGTSDTADILVWGWQQEALPFASSYIPTAGAAVTRAGDIVTIPWAMNINPSAVTVALNYDLAGNNKLQRLIEYAAAVNPRYVVQMSEVGNMDSFSGSSAAVVSSAPYGAGSTMVAATSITRHAFKLSGKAIVSATPDGPAQATTAVTIGAGISGVAPIYGHVRNLRIWHSALTDAQIKGLK